MLSSEQVQQFSWDGFVRLHAAFPRKLAVEGCQILWRDTGCDPEDPATWTKPVIRLGDYPQEPFLKAANMPCLHEAFDQLVGIGRWLPRTSLGTFPVRFPSVDDPGDAGWHAEASYGAEDGTWRLNVASSGRALLMLFLFSDVGIDDAPTRIRVGSHLVVPRLLKPYGEAGVSAFELDLSSTAGREVVHATGEAGTVYLCHPFLVHAAQRHQGRRPRFMAQPPLYPVGPLRLEDGESPVELAIRRGLERPPLAGGYCKR